MTNISMPVWKALVIVFASLLLWILWGWSENGRWLMQISPRGGGVAVIDTITGKTYATASDEPIFDPNAPRPGLKNEK